MNRKFLKRNGFYKKFVVCIIMITTTLSMSGCGERITTIQRTPTSKPLPPKFTGMLLVQADKDLYLLDANGKDTMLSATHLDVRGIDSISPDGRFILYFDIETGGKTYQIDVQSNQLQLLPIEASSSEYSWATDSSKFSYKSCFDTSGVKNGLFVFNLNGEIKQVYKAPIKKYDIVSGGVGSKYICGESTTGIWLDDQSLLFDYFLGDMPISITHPQKLEIQPNASALAQINDMVKVENVEMGQEIIYATCGEGAYLLAYQKSESDTDLKYLIMENHGNINQLQQMPIVVPNDYDPSSVSPKFYPGTCEVYLQVYDHYNDAYVVLYKPGAGDSYELISLGENIQPGKWAWDWMGEERPRAIVFLEKNALDESIPEGESEQTATRSDFITLRDLDSKQEVRLFNLGSLNKDMRSIYILGWYPK